MIIPCGNCPHPTALHKGGVGACKYPGCKCQSVGDGQKKAAQVRAEFTEYQSRTKRSGTKPVVVAVLKPVLGEAGDVGKMVEKEAKRLARRK